MPPTPLTVYTLANCDRCRAATKWLRAHEIAFSEKPIRETPPVRAEVQTMLRAAGDKRRLFNTSGRDYREQKLGERVEQMSDDEAIKLLTKNGNLVKRPFLIGDNVALVGFDEKAWAKALLT